MKIAVVGRVPPPPGGVGASILSVTREVSQLPNALAIHLNWHQLWRTFFKSYDVVHFNFSRPYKRLVGVLIARLAGSRVIHTIHSNNFEFDSIANKIAIALSHGFILVNERIFSEFSSRTSKPIALISPILAPETDSKPITEKKIDMSILGATRGFKVAAVYARGKDYRDEQETYGFLFVANLLPKLRELNVFVIYLDVISAYTTEELDPHGSGNFEHVKKGVDFQHLLKCIDVYLRPTATDGNSVAVLEAIQSGTPVVASDAVPRPEGVYVYESHDAEAFLSAIDRALRSAPLAEAQQQSRRQPNLSSVRDYMDFINLVTTSKSISP